MLLHLNYSGSECTGQNLQNYRSEMFNLAPFFNSIFAIADVDDEKVERQRRIQAIIEEVYENRKPTPSAVLAESHFACKASGSISYQADEDRASYLQAGKGCTGSFAEMSVIVSTEQWRRSACSLQYSHADLCYWRGARPKRIANNRSSSTKGLCRWAAGLGMGPAA
jgi:hypothetical protein